MHLRQLSLVNFKNYAEFEAGFSRKVNCFVGRNGVGKTNLLDAIHYLSFCKSYFNTTDSQNIRLQEGFFVIKGLFEHLGEETEIFCSFKRNQKKIFRRNKKEYDRLSEHIGLFPLVMISPSDSELINGSSELRRKFLDGIISQYDKVYLDKLISYTQVLKQRNALLKHFAETQTMDSETLDIWDEQLRLYGKPIVETRNQFLKEFIPLFNKYYQYISNSREHVTLEYESTVSSGDYRAQLMSVLPKDRVLGYTTIGPHKDDLAFSMEQFPLRKFASQGQQKSYLIGLKLAQFEFIRQKKNIKPMLLLDDVYDKLDQERFSRLLELVGSQDFGQVFLTDTHPDRINELLNDKEIEHRIFLVEDGVCSEYV